MPNELRKYLLDKFQAHLCEAFESYCTMHGLKQSNFGLITFLIDHDLIQKVDLQRFAVLKEIGQLLAQEAANKTQVVNIISHRFNLSERTVWNILKHQQRNNQSGRLPSVVNRKRTTPHEDFDFDAPSG